MAKTDQTEQMIRLICFFSHHADNFVGFITQSLLAKQGCKGMGYFQNKHVEKELGIFFHRN